VALTSTPGLIVIGSAFALGLLLVFVGRWGRRIDDHPVCRACGFDLYGSLNREGDGAGNGTRPATCPECGQALTSPHALRRGNRRPMRSLRATGLALALPGLTLGGLTLYGIIGRGTINQYKPTDLLQWEASLTSVLADPALDELLRRNKQGTLAKDELEALLDESIEVQSDPGRRWIEDWGRVVVAARKAGVGKKQQYQQFIRVAADVTEKQFRDKIHRHMPLAFGVWYDADGQGHRHVNTRGLRLTEITIDGETYQRPPSGTRPRYWKTRAPAIMHLAHGLSNRVQPGRVVGHPLRLGTHTIALDYQITASIGATPSTTSSFTVRRRFEVVSDETRLVEQVCDAPTARTIEKMLKDQMSIRVYTGLRRYDYAIHLDDGPELPISLGHRVFIRAQGRLWRVLDHRRLGESVAGERLSAGDFMSGDHWPADLRPKRVDVIFRPSEKVAAQRADLTRFLDHKLVIEDVPVDWSQVEEE
jgi:hypothetical protein